MVRAASSACNLNDDGTIKYAALINLCIQQLPLMEVAILANWREMASNYTRSGFVNRLMHCLSNGRAAWDQEGLFRGIDWSMFENPEEAAVGGNEEAGSIAEEPGGNGEAAVGGNDDVENQEKEPGAIAEVPHMYQQVIRGIDWSMFENAEEAAVGGNEEAGSIAEEPGGNGEAAVGGNDDVENQEKEPGAIAEAQHMYQQVRFGEWFCAAGDACEFSASIDNALVEANFTFNGTEWCPKHRCKQCRIAVHSPCFCGAGEGDAFICGQCNVAA
jgi:hypothetical protein